MESTIKPPVSIKKGDLGDQKEDIAAVVCNSKLKFL
jgi:hypothetical protein